MASFVFSLSFVIFLATDKIYASHTREWSHTHFCILYIIPKDTRTLTGDVKVRSTVQTRKTAISSSSSGGSGDDSKKRPTISVRCSFMCVSVYLNCVTHAQFCVGIIPAAVGLAGPMGATAATAARANNKKKNQSIVKLFLMNMMICMNGA